MPEYVRDTRLPSGLLLFSLTMSMAICSVAAGQTPPDPAQNTPAAGNNGSPENGAASAPENPVEAYQLDQRKRVQALRRMDESLLTPQILAKFQKESRDYRTLIAVGTNGRNQKELETLRTGLQYRILSMSDGAVQNDPIDRENALKNFRRDLLRAGAQITNSQTRAQFRELVCKESLDLIRKLLTNNFLARSFALEILPDLEVVPPGNQTRMVMYDQVDEVFVEVLRDPEQPDAVKARAVNSITNYLQKADAIPQIQMALASAISDELSRPYTEVAYQVFLLAALEEVTAPRQLVAPTTAVSYCIAARLMRDKNRDIQVRCRAARVMGRTGYDAQINLEVLSWATADLVLETAARFNKDRNKNDPKWVTSAYYLYTAFHHWERDEATGRAPALPKGFLNRDARSEVVKKAYELSIPVISHMLMGKADVPNRSLIPLFQWTGDNKPANLKFDPSCPPLVAAGSNGAAADGGQ